jgi:transposase InsO family protein
VRANAVELVRECVGCQKSASQSHIPVFALKTIPLTWLFTVWGMDVVGKFKTAPGGYNHLLFVVDKFTKWVHAKPIKKCDGKTTTKFLRELIYRYGYPHSIITHNGTNFAKGEMAEFCEENGIRLDLASVAHLESNGQASQPEHPPRPQATIGSAMEQAAGCWAEELMSVL